MSPYKHFVNVVGVGIVHQTYLIIISIRIPTIYYYIDIPWAGTFALTGLALGMVSSGEWALVLICDIKCLYF